MATIASIDSSIRLYTTKISERENFITKAQNLIDDAGKASEELLKASDNLALGLTIGGQSADGGKLAEMSATINTNVSTLSEAITAAAKEIVTYDKRIVDLKRERDRLVAEEIAATKAAEKAADKAEIARKKRDAEKM